MLGENKSKRKTAGFIKTNSLKRIPIQKQVYYNESSDDFSSFQYHMKNNDDSEQFSPYKYSIPQKKIINKNTKQREMIQRRKKIQNLFSNEKLKKNYFYDEGKQLKKVGSQKYMLNNNKRKTQQIQENLAQAQQICDKIYKMRMTSLSKQKQKVQKPQSKHKLLHNYKVDFQYSFDKNNQQQNKNNIKKNNKCKTKNKKYQVNIPQYYQYSESSQYNSQQEYEDKNNYYKLKEKNIYKDSQEQMEIQRNKSAKKKFLQSMNQQNSSQYPQNYSSCQPIQDQYTTFKPNFVNKSLKKSKNTIDKFHKTKGGVCFQLDINQFYYPQDDLKYKIQKLNQIRQKKTNNKKKNTKQDILKRRKLARAYDRQSRNRIFGS